MRVLAISGANRREEGITALILDPFLEGLRETGAEVELIYTKDLDLQPCTGDLACLLKTPGECYIQDDMQMLCPKLLEADTWVFAAPVYAWDFPAAIQMITERFLALIDGRYDYVDGHTRCRMSRLTAAGQLVLVSSCSEWELDQFDAMLTKLKLMCPHVKKTLAGALLRPHATVLPFMIANRMGVDDILAAARQAGVELGTQGRISEKTMATVSRPLMPPECYMEAFNNAMEQRAAAAKGSGEEGKGG